MYKILRKKSLNSTVTLMDIEAPLVAAKAQAGQFIILRVDENGERIPLTIASYDEKAGSVTIIFQVVGATTMLLNQKKEGEYIQDFAGPLGKPSEVTGFGKVCVVGGGVGCAIALPLASAFKKNGAQVTSIAGFRTKDLVILEEEFKEASDRFFVVTDDGSYGKAGRVTDMLQSLLEKEKFDLVVAIGPLVMMKYLVQTCRPFNVPVTVSMNPIMIDGTGMCGGCRLSLVKDGKREMKFACVDGPEFNGYEVDFDEAISRSRLYSDYENKAREKICNLFKETK